ncbi:MAG: alpha/beta hydrolase [Rubritalea sp.]|uniref:alpha/beta hydrolase n=1 Tax=Rubritalea sp. TaxID=2109375 RepID=UPI0032422E5A
MLIKRLITSLCLLSQLSLVSCASETDLRSAVVLGLMGKGGGDRLFYYPTKDAPFTPAKHGYAYEDVTFKASDGVKLHGWWLPTQKKSAKATIVYSHGNAGSLPHHVVFVYWLVDAGYNVMMYDYRGYGKSEGEVSKEGAVEDAKAAFAYAAGREDVDGIISFGHSLGGAKSIAALAESAPKKLKAVIVDSTFASYKDMAERVAGPRARKVVTDTYDPCVYVKKLPKGMPVLVVHGSADSTIPFAQAEKLVAAANPPKRLIRVEGGDHVNCFFVEKGKYRTQLLRWMNQTLAP